MSSASVTWASAARCDTVAGGIPSQHVKELIHRYPPTPVEGLLNSLNELLVETEIVHTRRHAAAGTTLDEPGARALFEIVRERYHAPFLRGG